MPRRAVVSFKLNDATFPMLCAVQLKPCRFHPFCSSKMAVVLNKCTCATLQPPTFLPPANPSPNLELVPLQRQDGGGAEGVHARELRWGCRCCFFTQPPFESNPDSSWFARGDNGTCPRAQVRLLARLFGCSYGSSGSWRASRHNGSLLQCCPSAGQPHSPACLPH